MHFSAYCSVTQMEQKYTQGYQCTSELFQLLSIWQYGRQKLTSNSLEEDFAGGSEVEGSPLWLYITSVGQKLQVFYWKISEPVSAAVVSNNSSQIIPLLQQPSALSKHSRLVDLQIKGSLIKNSNDSCFLTIYKTMSNSIQDNEKLQNNQLCMMLLCFCLTSTVNS